MVVVCLRRSGDAFIRLSYATLSLVRYWLLTDAWLQAARSINDSTPTDGFRAESPEKSRSCRKKCSTSTQKSSIIVCFPLVSCTPSNFRDQKFAFFDKLFRVQTCKHTVSIHQPDRRDSSITRLSPVGVNMSRDGRR